MRTCRRLPPVAAVLAACALLAGCVEADEEWTFDDKGGGVYALTLRWNADLWRRATDVLGPSVMARLEGRAFPLRASQWRDGLEGLPGLEVVDLVERDTDTGMREVAVRVRFARLRDMLRWEVLARRTVRVELEPPDGGGAEAPRRCRFYMEPVAQVPVLDRLGALLDAEERPPPPAEGAAAARDPPPLERLGIERAAAEMVWRMVKQPLEQVQLRVRVRVPGVVVRRAGRPASDGAKEVERGYDFPALRDRTTDRTVRFTWQMLSFDQAPLVVHEGDRDLRTHRNPDGTLR